MKPTRLHRPRRDDARPSAWLPAAALAVAAVAALATPAPATAQSSLAYRLEPGDRLVYRQEVAITDARTAAAIGGGYDDIEIWCLGSDGAERLILIECTSQRGGQPPDPPRGGVLYVELNGRRRFPPEMIPRAEELASALAVLPILPLGAQLDAAWATPPDFYHRSWRCASRGPDPRQAGCTKVEFAVEDHLGVLEALGQQVTGRFWFDTAAGSVARYERVETDQRRNTSTIVSATLRERLRQSPDWVLRRADEANRFLRTLQQEARLLQELVERPEDVERTLGQLDQAWAALKSDVEVRSLSPFADLADARRQELRAARAALESRAAMARRWLGRKAGTWTLQNPAGETITSESARQGVVVECFWSGESGAALHALEPMRRLQAATAELRVRVLSYNLDEDLVRAPQVCQQCAAGLTNILAGPLRQVETLPELPVVRVLDPKGVVRGIWVGWQPDYAAARDLAMRLARTEAFRSPDAPRR